jgi:hypothetical protein
MRLAWKQSAALLVCIGLVVGTHALLRVRGVTETFVADMQRDHHAIGRGLGVALADVWGGDGEARALMLVERANEREGGLRLRWTEVGAAPASRRGPLAPPQILAAATPGQDTHWIDPSGEGRLVTYVAVEVPGRRGALEISESLKAQRAFA